jgi:hypothetical protein
MAGALLLAFAAACAQAATPAPAAPAPSTARPVPGEPGEAAHPPAMPVPVELPARPGEAGVREFVGELMKARLAGDAARARDFLSPTALEQYARSEGGLTLTAPSTGPLFADWDFAAVDAADASSWEVRVRIQLTGQRAQTLEETLFIGPGPDASETQRPWIVRGARRSS